MGRRTTTSRTGWIPTSYLTPGPLADSVISQAVTDQISSQRTLMDGSGRERNRKPKGWKYKPWSPTGHLKKSQPDNAEFGINNTTESCLALLNNIYEDGVKWHDVACYHRKNVLCEDSNLLIDYIKATNKRIRL